MNIRNVVNRDREYFARLNEEINLYAEKYGERTAKSYYRGMVINEDGEQAQQPTQNQQAQQQAASQQPAIDNQKMLQDFGNIGQQLEKFVQAYSNSTQAKELNDLLNSMKNLANAMKNNQPVQSQNQNQTQA